MFRLLKIAGVVVTGVVGLWVVGALLQLFVLSQNCAGRLSECYRATKIPDPLMAERLGSLTQFAASRNAIAFPVVLDKESGLLFIDRRSGRSKLIYNKGESYWAPYLSADDERLLLIRRHDGTAQREIISCSVDSWRCRVLLRTEYNLRSPVEADRDTIVFAGTPPRIGKDGNRYYVDWDIRLLKMGSDEVQLTGFRLGELPYVQPSGNKIVFSGLGPKPANPVLPKLDVTAPSRSDVYSVEWNKQKPEQHKSGEMLSPLFSIGGYSVQASVSPDGSRAAILNTEARGRYRFDMVLADMNGTVDRRIVVEGMAFSPGMFVGDTLLFNELFENYYKLLLFDYSGNSLRSVAEIDHAPEKLIALERIPLAIEGETRAELRDQARPQ